MRVTLYDKATQSPKIDSAEYSYSGEWMGERSLTVSFKSPVPITFGIGDYVMYRGERFELNVTPSEQKQARIRRVGNAFVYENVKLNSLTDELVRCNFLDYVLYDNELAFVSNPTFSFYAKDVKNLAERLQANLDRLYTGDNSWQIIVDENFTSKENILVQCDKINVWEALALAYTEFDCKFIISKGERKITIGCSGENINMLSFGVGNGIKKITRSTDDSQAVVTRLRAYGSDKNMPYHYYYYKKTENSIPVFYSRKTTQDLIYYIRGTESAISAFASCLVDVKAKEERYTEYNVKVEMKDTSARLVSCDAIFSYSASSPDTSYFTFKNVASRTFNSSMHITVTYGLNSQKPLPIEYIKNKEDVGRILPVHNLMLPGYPANEDPYIDSDNISQYGIREATVFFDGSDDLDDIYPTIEGFDNILVADSEPITDNGIFPEGHDLTDDEKYFYVHVKNLGFDPRDKNLSIGQNPHIGFQDGMLGGRDFEIVETTLVGENYTLKCLRVEDSSLHQFFPNSDYNAKSGDKYIYTDLYMPDLYVEKASERLELAARAWLAENDHVQYKYSIEVDDVFFAYHPELANVIKEGDLVLLNDENLGISNVVVEIDKLTIALKEGKDNPTYNISLNDKKEVGTIQRIQNAIKGITSGTTIVNGGGSGVSGTQATNIANELIKNYDESANSKFLRKDIDDEVNANTLFNKALMVGGDLQVNEIASMSGDGVLVNDMLMATDNISTSADMECTESNAKVFRANNGSKDTAIIDGYEGIFNIDKGIASTGSVIDTLQGSGFHIFKDENSKWNGYFDNLFIRQSLTTLELVYERVKVNSGTIWNAPGAGKVLSFQKRSANTGYINLALENGEIGSFVAGDLCLGIYHFETGNAEADSADGLQVKGFKTVYFRVQSVAESASGKADNGRLSIIAREADSFPCENMTIVAFGNMSDTSRQSSAYETRTFKRYLYGIDSYDKLGKAENIAMQLGDLSNLTISGKSLSGYSAYLNNVYFSGIIQQLKSEGLNVLNWCGDYSSNATYNLNDEVYYDGVLYVWNDEQPGNVTPPSTKWKKVSEKSTGAPGADAMALLVENKNDYIQCDSNGVTKATTIKSVIRLAKGNAILNSGVSFFGNDESTDITDIRHSSAIWLNDTDYVEPNVSVSADRLELTWTIDADKTAYTTRASIKVGAIYNGVKYYETLQFIVLKDGERGIQGMTGAVVRPRGVYDKDKTYKSDSEFIDVVLYNGNFYRPLDGKTITNILPTNTSYWTPFSQFDNIAVGVLLANQGNIDVLGAGSLFVGDVNKQTGWIMTNGAIRHNKTGLTLTADGKLSIPNGGLSFKVGTQNIDEAVAQAKQEAEEAGAYATSIDNGLLDTGIDLSGNKINLTADNLVCKNNAGENTMWLNRQGDLAISGNYYNMAQEINLASGKNSHLLISEQSIISGINYNNVMTDRYCLDVLHCGNVLSIKELDRSILLPCFISDAKFCRTRVNNDELTSNHLITRDEMRQILGKEITIYVENDDAATLRGKLVTGAFPDDVYITPYSAQNYGVLDVINGNVIIEQFDANAHEVAIGNGSAVKIKLVSARLKTGTSTGTEVYYWQCQYSDQYACFGWN